MISGRLSEFRAALPQSCLDLERIKFSGVSIDSRTVRAGNIFVCIRGANHDGHDYAAAAAAAGAAAVIAQKNRQLNGDNIAGAILIEVENTLHTLGELAAEYLRQISPARIAITGTNGKTTCKNLLARIFESKYRTCSTKGNFNNLIGVPLSILEFERDCEMAVFELGMSIPGEILRLVEIVKPQVRVMLNIGAAHLKTMKSIEAIAKAKFELLQNAGKDDWAVLNIDDQQIRSRYYRYRMNKITYGCAADAEVSPQEVRANGCGHVHFDFHGTEFVVPLLGKHHVGNVLAAIAVSQIYDISLATVKRQIESYLPPDGRMSETIIRGITIIDDAYNANPASVKAAVETISNLRVAGKRIAVIGDMRELGGQAEEFHHKIGVHLGKSQIDRAVLIGEYAKTIRTGILTTEFNRERIHVVANFDELVDFLSKILNQGDLLLLKASRALQFEKIKIALRAIMGRTN